MQFEIKTLLSTPLATNNYLLVGNDFAVLVEATASVEQNVSKKLFITKNNSMETERFRLKGVKTKSFLFVTAMRLRLAMKNFCVYRRQVTQTTQ